MPERQCELDRQRQERTASAETRIRSKPLHTLHARATRDRPGQQVNAVRPPLSIRSAQRRLREKFQVKREGAANERMHGGAARASRWLPTRSPVLAACLSPKNRGAARGMLRRGFPWPK